MIEELKLELQVNLEIKEKLYEQQPPKTGTLKAKPKDYLRGSIDAYKEVLAWIEYKQAKEANKAEALTEEDKQEIIKAVDVTITYHATNVDEIVELILRWGTWTQGDWTNDGITLDILKKLVYAYRIDKLFDQMEQVSELVWLGKDTPPEDNNPDDQTPKDTTP